MSKPDMAGMRRRTLLGAGAALALPGRALAQFAPSDPVDAPSVNDLPIIDSHIHLFDGNRPIGAEYTGSIAYRAISKVSTPLMYAQQAAPLGVRGAIVIQSSKWLEENLFYMEMCDANPFMLAVCGWLDTGMPDFGQYIERWHRNPLYRAIRFSSFYNDDNGKITLNPVHVANIKLLAEADMVLETQTPTIALLTANSLIADAVPNLRIVQDHLPSFDPNPANQKDYERVVQEMGKRPNIHIKLSEVYHPQRNPQRTVERDYGKLKARLDFLYGVFGEDRVIFGSDYPNSYGIASIPEEIGLMKRFFATKTRREAEKYFWQNSQKLYHWKRRLDSQPSLS